MIPSHFFLAMQAMVLAVLPAANGPVSEPSDMGRVVSVADFGAKGDGATDDTAAVQAAAVAAAGGTLKFPHRPAAYRITGTVTIRGSTRVIGDDSKILMALGPDHPTGRLFYVAGDDVEIGGLWIDASGANPRVTGNRYAIAIVGTAERHLRNVHVRNCKFTNLPWADAKAVIATHALYNKWADLSTVENCIADAVAGAAVFVSQSNGVRIINNDINNPGGYSIQLQDRVEGALVSGNRITGTVPGGRMWGGSVNLMSNGRDLGAGKARIKRVLITGNEISGVHSYTGAIQIESSSYISFNHNKMADISLTNKLPPAYVRVYTRPQGDKTDEGASDNIDVSDNTLIARGPDCIGDYVDNQRFGGQESFASGLSVGQKMHTRPDE